MNGEDIFNAVTHIRDGTIDEAGAPAKRRKRRWWIPALAAMLAAAVALGALLPREGDPVLTAYAIAEPELPERQVFSRDDPEAWARENRELRLLGDTYAGTLADWYDAAVPGLLSGAGSENRVLSPVDLYLALGMLAEVTGGESREQILDLLGCSDLPALRQRAGALWNANYRKDGQLTSLLANSLWLRQDLDYVRDPLDTLARDYYASSYRGQMGSPDYDRALRDWLNANTGGRLREQAENIGMDPDTLLALASALYFRARWTNEFDPDDTQPGAFHAPTGDEPADFMRQTLWSGTYCWGETFTAAAMPLDGSGDMWLILPDEGLEVDQVLADPDLLALLETRSWEWDRSQLLNIHLSVPKFDVTSDLDLVGSLRALGVTDVFDPAAADLSPMLAPGSPAAYVSQVQHAARVTVDEEGCEAAAYTVIMAATGGASPDGEIDFTLDRPFLFAITGEDGQLLFTGIVNHP